MYKGTHRYVFLSGKRYAQQMHFGVNDLNTSASRLNYHLYQGDGGS